MTRSVVTTTWRFRRALPPGFRFLWRTMVWAFWLIYFSFIVLVLALRYSILPNIENYRPALERLARKSGRPSASDVSKPAGMASIPI